MKTSQTVTEGLTDMKHIETGGDVRRLLGTFMLGLARKEVSATDAEAMAKCADAISNSLGTELKVLKAKLEMHAAGADIGKIQQLGQLVIASSPTAPPAE